MILAMNFARGFAACLAALMWGGIGTASALDYPTRPVRWIVTYPPGGGTDITARIMAQWLSERLGQQFIIENKPGAGNNIGTEAAIHSPPDGYTLLLVNPANAINATLYPKLSFNFIRDIAPVAGIMRVPNVMEVNPSVPAKTVAEFIAYAKANPGKINWATSGNGTSVHLSGELFKMMTGVELTHIPYKGSAPALRPDRRHGARDFRQYAAVAAAHPRRQAARARGDDGDTVGRVARRSDGGRDSAGLRGQRLLRDGRAEGHPARNHRQAQPGDQRRFGRPEGQGSPCGAWRHAGPGQSGGLRKARRRGNRQMGQGDQGRRREPGIGEAYRPGGVDEP
jgi:Tripartite tricarboxylate transporter family receptor